jgi:hypothetical protein
LTPASYQPGLFLAIDNNQGKEKAMAKSPSDQAADAAREVLSKIEDVTLAVKNDIESLSGIADAAEMNLDDLYESAELLCREIVDTLQLPSDPVALATVEAIDNLLALLLEAKNYLESGQSLAALGTLQLFDNHADDLKAARPLMESAAALTAAKIDLLPHQVVLTHAHPVLELQHNANGGDHDR